MFLRQNNIVVETANIVDATKETFVETSKIVDIEQRNRIRCSNEQCRSDRIYYFFQFSVQCVYSLIQK